MISDDDTERLALAQSLMVEITVRLEGLAERGRPSTIKDFGPALQRGHPSRQRSSERPRKIGVAGRQANTVKAPTLRTLARVLGVPGA